ncbi:MAG: hypothetical protein RIF44_22685, partial [Nitratireductor sp.]
PLELEIFRPARPGALTPNRERTVMTGMLAFDRLAAQRNGDGLHPRLRALLEHQAERVRAGIVDLDATRSVDLCQAGPNPSRNRPARLPPGVVSFPEPETDRCARTPTPLSKA